MWSQIKYLIKLRTESTIISTDVIKVVSSTSYLYIVNEINLCSYDLGTYFTLANSLFGAVMLIKNADPNKYSYSGMVLDLMHNQLFHCLVVMDLVKI